MKKYALKGVDTKCLPLAMRINCANTRPDLKTDEQLLGIPII